MNEDIDDVLTKFLGKESLTEEEKLLFKEWEYDSAHNEKIGKIIRRLNSQKHILDKHQKQEAVFSKIEKQIKQTRRKRQLVHWSSYAAVIILLIAFCFIIRQNKQPKEIVPVNQMYISGLPIDRPAAELILPDGNKRLLSQEKTTIIISDSNRDMRTDKQTLIVISNDSIIREPEFYTINVPFGAEYNLKLSDGSKIFLNAGSSLRYPDQFSGKKREIFLTGEAYFEVASDSSHPFIVHTPDVVIRVLGTSFNVNAYPDGKWVKTTLVQGRVEAKCGDNSFIMQPGTQVAYNKETQEAKCFPVNTQQYISWKNGYYDFEDMPLGELMQIFTRWYNIKLEFAKSELKEIKFSGRLKRYDDLRPLFKMLEYTRDIRFIIREDKIIIQEK